MYPTKIIFDDCCDLNEHCDNSKLGFEKSKHYISDEETKIISFEDESELNDFMETYLSSLSLPIECFSE